MTEKQANKLPHGTKMQWNRGTETDTGILIHDITESWIDWKDGQRTYTHDDGAMPFVLVAKP
jgi:hypothetical protein